MPFSLPDLWVWDSWFVEADGVDHMFFLNAPKSVGDPDQRHFYASIGHATSKDLTNWDYHGTAIEASAGPAWDDLATWTGSAFQRPDGKWMMFYTAISRAERGHVQRIGAALSDDLFHWEKMGNAPLVEADAQYYQKLNMPGCIDEACRDPFVFPDPDGNGWHMYFTASGHNDATNENGVIGHATSEDLDNWTVQPPIFKGAIAGELEVPEIFELKGRWYLLYSTWSRNVCESYRAAANGPVHSGTHYMISSNGELGPWNPAVGNGLLVDEKDRIYVARRVRGQSSLNALIAFNNADDRGEFPGTLTDPIEFDALPDGSLTLSAPDTLKNEIL